MYAAELKGIHMMPLKKEEPILPFLTVPVGPAKTPLLFKTLPVNDLSPLALYQKINWPAPSFLLDGSKNGWFNGVFSLLGLTPFGIFQSKGQTSHFDLHISGKEMRTSITGDPLLALQHWLDQFHITAAAPAPLAEIPFVFGGAVGFFSYELARQFEHLPETQDDTFLPDIHLLFLNFFIVFDHQKNLIHLIYNPSPEIQLGKPPEAVYRDAHEKIASMTERLTAQESSSQPLKNLSKTKTENIEAITQCSKEHYIEMVRRAKIHIEAGDIFQANLSHTFSAACPFESIFGLYQRLWEINPSPFSAYLDLGEIQIASGSPERLVRLTKKDGETLVETRPIAGTRPRGLTPAEDEAHIASLYQSAKERAEHLMLVDLERNDLGKVCQYGSVSVDSLMALEKYSHVLHLVSNIKGVLRPNTSALAVLKALFPGGTITGVPKIRCMEIISGLEGRARGLYTGSIGYIGFDGTMDLNIAIRTWVRHKEKMMFQVGAGIVADSDPEKEYQETLHKAAALMEALRPFQHLT